MACPVEQRAREIGVRVALGAKLGALHLIWPTWRI
jgi:hypothetical protein